MTLSTRPSSLLRHRHTVELTDSDLRVLRAALEAYLEDFGHDEADVTRRIREVTSKVPPVHGGEASQ